MAHMRNANLPFDHLLSELVAFPLTSEAALTNPITHLDRGMSGGTGPLWRAAERELITAFPAISLDELVALRDLCWFGGGSDTRSLAEHLRTASSRVLAGSRHRFPARPDHPFSVTPGRGSSRQVWRWLTQALPADLLLATSAHDEGLPDPDPFSPPVRDLLRRGFAESHLHVGAALDFGTVWALTTARLATSGRPLRQLRAPGAALAEGTKLIPWLVRAAIGRVVLAAFLAHGGVDPFDRFLYGPQCGQRIARHAGATTYTVVLTALSDLASGLISGDERNAWDEADMRAALAALAPPDSIDRARDLAAVRALDPIEKLLLPRTGGTAEQCYVARMCAYIDGCDANGRPDRHAATLFWQTVRIRTLLYRYLTQRPLTPGLSWFIRFYGRMSSARDDVPQRVLVQAAGLTSGVAEGLCSLEMRTSPEEDLDDMQRWVKAITSCAKEKPAPSMAMVFHFVKSRGGGVEEGLPKAGGAGTNADPRANPKGYRYGRFFAKQKRRAISLANLLHRWPRTQFVVRGLDICSDELAIPTWVLRPLLRYVHEAADQGRRHLQSRGDPVPAPLRTTVHAGEDFAHLLTGLRQIHEAVDLLDLCEGDRIGHGFALGVDPQRWALKAGRVAIPLEDRVFDLAWEWGWWTSRGSGADAARLAYIERTVLDLTQHWFDDRLTPMDVEDLRAALTHVDTLADAGFPHHAPRPGASPSRTLIRYLTDARTFQLGQTVVWTDPANEVESLVNIGTALRLEIARRLLAIEINPTSNLLIGDLGDLESHPLWRLCPPRPRADLPPLAITVGSDDPLVFNCRLPGEYQLLFDALAQAGLTDAEAMTWLDHVRRSGLERRFTEDTIPAEDLFAVVNTRSFKPLPL